VLRSATPRAARRHVGLELATDGWNIQLLIDARDRRDSAKKNGAADDR
jgi:hypothetical protein